MHELLFFPPGRSVSPSAVLVQFLFSVLSCWGLQQLGLRAIGVLGFPGCFVLQLFFFSLKVLFVHYDAIFIYENQNIREELGCRIEKFEVLLVVEVGDFLIQLALF